MDYAWLSLLLLSFALSLDSFGVGITYGLRKMRIPLGSIVVISLCSGLIIMVSMQAGTLLMQFLSPTFASLLGAVILIGIGCWSLLHPGHSKADKEEVQKPLLREQEPASADADRNVKMLFSVELRKIGLVIHILRSPSAADTDQSGSISAKEAVWLGIALSLDAFGAGLGAAMLGFNPLLTAAAIALFSGLFLIAGMKAGFRLSAFRFMRVFGLLPALLLIIMGMMKLL
ncbi:sporulation membrane protein YtaF [Paenibacillus sp. P96]|uniref:Sporulation membrane protein YtaF n=1 Tax=Paenibacillus zeirhizosphaerae TaxID=2987519 RepID=A0ABT9FT00_9BACL|nr:sporulation membrane protein YtaF [Paenibacillus sp. P96]MDP4097864.1 sporulation membrane protein YtaF [Paenibacillus sp. P96]